MSLGFAGVLTGKESNFPAQARCLSPENHQKGAGGYSSHHLLAIQYGAAPPNLAAGMVTPSVGVNREAGAKQLPEVSADHSRGRRRGGNQAHFSGT
jgi:hypothetical protein